MQWIVLALWGLLMVFCLRLGWHRPFRFLTSFGLASAMLCQLLLLQLDGMLTVETAFPLHLCGLFGVLSIPLLYCSRGPLWEASAFLAAPAAFITLFYPAVMNCSHPFLMKAAFYQLHVLIVVTPVFLFCTGKPLPV